MRLTRLTCEYLENPLGLDTVRPRLGWRVESTRGGFKQGAYQVLAASEEGMLAADRADLWDSGWVESGLSQQIEWEGKTLTGGRACWWKARIRDDLGELGPWSDAAFFEIGLLEGDWRGYWIGDINRHTESAPLFRRAFRVEKPVARARFYLCGLGYHELSINGRKIGDHELDPAQTDYGERAMYVTHDVTRALQAGENALGIMLGCGFFDQNRVWVPGRRYGLSEAPSYGRPRLIAQLVIRYADGSVDMIASDGRWKVAQGPIGMNNVYAGEEYDARREQPGWDLPGFNDRAWAQAVPTEGPGGRLCAQRIPPIKRREILSPVALTEARPGCWVYDLGQNFAGRVRLRLSGVAHEEITLRFAETLDASGMIDTASTGVFATAVEQVDRYRNDARDAIDWETRFVWHGFRYVELRGVRKAPAPDALEGVALYSAVEPRGAFSCSHETVNALHRASVWTQKSNMHSVPEDCPARERCGWLADAFIAADMASSNFHMAAFYAKYMEDIDTTRKDGIPWDIAPGKRRAARGIPDWIAAYIILPWHLYVWYGDRQILARSWRGMRLVMDHLMGRAKDGVLRGGRGDWCDPGTRTNPEQTPEAVTTTAWYGHCAGIMGKAASVLGDREASTRYAPLASEIREAFRKNFFDSGRKTCGSQAADAMAIALGYVEGAEAAAMAGHLEEETRVSKNGHAWIGIFGLRYFFDVLSRHGHGETALRSLVTPDYPSLGNLISRGATTLWEYYGEAAVDAYDGPRSLNHPMMACFDAWFYQGILGIRPDEAHPGFKEFLLEPQFLPGLSHAEGHFDSPYGRIESQWRRTGTSIEWRVVVPPNTRATIRLPVDQGDKPLIVKSMKSGAQDGGSSTLPSVLGSGEYTYRLDGTV
jgi:alpha-L-rhamnosidase